jgi:ankyrin repeat protein
MPWRKSDDVVQDAIRKGDLETLKRFVAEGLSVVEVNPVIGYTMLLYAAHYGRIPIMDWLLNKGGSSLTEKTNILEYDGMSALLVSAFMGRFPATQYLLEEQGTSVSEIDHRGNTVWDKIISGTVREPNSAAELSSLLKVMVMLEDAPADFIVNPRLSPQHTEICTRGRHLRAQLPSYLEQQQATRS